MRTSSKRDIAKRGVAASMAAALALGSVPMSAVTAIATETSTTTATTTLEDADDATSRLEGSQGGAAPVTQGEGYTHDEEANTWTVTTAEGLKAALAAAQESGGTVVLGEDITLTERLTISQSVTLEGNGRTITGVTSDAGVFFEVTGGTFTISDAELTGFGDTAASVTGAGVIKVPATANGAKVVATDLTIKNFNRAALDVRNGAFEVTNCTINCDNSQDQRLTKGIVAGYDAAGAVTGTVTGGTISGADSTYEGWSASGIEVSAGSTVVIDGTTITSMKGGVSVARNYGTGAADVTVRDCDITASDFALRVYQGSTSTPGNADATASLTVDGGSYSGDVRIGAGSGYEADPAKASISLVSGTFRSVTTEGLVGLVAAGSKVAEVEGVYAVSEVDLVSAVESAQAYVYEDYSYAGEFEVSGDAEQGLTITGTYSQSAFDAESAMNDLARFLGALHRFDDGASVRSITFDGNAYTWDVEPENLKGSNWRHEGTTLVSAIVRAYAGGAQAFDVTLSDGADELGITFGFDVRDENPGGGSGGNGGGGVTPTPEPDEDVTENPDGSTTTTTTETTKGEDGSTTTTVTEVTEGRPDGSTTEKVTETVEDAEGNKTVTVTETNTLKDGTSATVVTDGEGKVGSVEAVVSEEAAAAGAVTLPMAPVAAADSGNAPEIKVDAPAGARVTVPVAAEDGVVSPSAVLVLVAADGTETVMPKTSVSGEGLTLELEGGATLKVVDNAVSFPDISEDDWYVGDGVAGFVSARGIMTGAVLPDGSVEFRGDEQVDRAMFVTMLHRLELEGAPTSGESFGDVSEGDWFAGAAAWGSENGLVTGYDDGTGRFGGTDSVTREQMAVMLHRYAAWLGLDTSARADLEFPDAGEVSDWASEAMSWAVAEGLFRGSASTGELNPGDGATRAEAAAVMMRLVNEVIG